MTFDLTKLGPRGWALAVIICGCTLSTPFLRSQSSSQTGNANELHAFSSAQPVQSPLSTPPAPSPNHSCQAAPSGKSSFQLPTPGAIAPHRHLTHSSSRAVDASPPTASPPHPISAEFPDWARKPSPLDELIETQTSKNGPQEPEQQAHELEKTPRVPKPLKTWASQGDSFSHAAPSEALNVDRHSPFADDSHPLTSPSNSLAQVVWPDQKLLPAMERPTRPTTQLVRTPTNSGAMPESLSMPRSAIISSEQSRSEPIGAAIRSTVVPGRELFILQPGMSKELHRQ